MNVQIIKAREAMRSANAQYVAGMLSRRDNGTMDRLYTIWQAAADTYYELVRADATAEAARS